MFNLANLEKLETDLRELKAKTVQALVKVIECQKAQAIATLNPNQADEIDSRVLGVKTAHMEVESTRTNPDPIEPK